VLPAASCLASQPFFNKDISFERYYTKMPPSNPHDQSESFSFSPLYCSPLTTERASPHEHRRSRSRRPAVLSRFTLPLLDARQPRRQTSSLPPEWLPRASPHDHRIPDQSTVYLVRGLGSYLVERWRRVCTADATVTEQALVTGLWSYRDRGRQAVHGTSCGL
jgi:hypothetical protein